ncbi:hypothetical protein Mal4_03430 [Maioricimonas rarisocia]|uniref:Uncharacterized protein n=1 Tax=Maioricimonas rarisocia TaxID=2528026 RepID=A0A517Z0Q7_9PLAN|nr:hypothetical protein Mal4_03430 [Maioricimonas rarisocia]
MHEWLRRKSPAHLNISCPKSLVALEISFDV